MAETAAPLEMSRHRNVLDERNSTVNAWTTGRLSAVTASVIGLLAGLLVGPGAAGAGPGRLTQSGSTDGCISHDGTDGLCTDADLLFGAFSVAVSKDGKNAYVALIDRNAVAVLSRNRATGALTQLAQPQGCISENGNAGLCADGKGLLAPVSVAVSPDDKHVYVASFQTDPVSISSVAVFARDKVAGTLAQLSGLDGCISEDGTGGACTDGKALRGTSSVTVSKDGRHVYVASRASDAVAVFARDKTTGKLTQLPGQQGCISEGGSGGLCATARGLDDVTSVAVSPDGNHVYATSHAGDTIAVLTRNRTTGALTQLPGPEGCVTEGGSVGPCDAGTAIMGPNAVVVSPDGKQVYVASELSNAVAVFARDRSTGALIQLPDPQGCISEDGTGGVCTDGVALERPESLAITGDGKHVYVGSKDSDGVAGFARDRTTGALTPIGCVSDEGTGGACFEVRALQTPRSVFVSKNGRHLYVAAQGSAAVAVFRRER